MTLDQQLKDKISKALESKKLDTSLSSEFRAMVKMGALLNKALGNPTLDTTVSYFAMGNPQNTPQGMRKSLSETGVYTAKTTYRELLDHVENPVFTRFEKAQKYQPL